MRRRLALGILAGAAGCGGGAAADHERLGDAAMAASRPAEAYAEYVAGIRAAASPRLWGKAGGAALQAARWRDGVEAFAQLGAADADRVAEASTGIERALDGMLRNRPLDSEGARRGIRALRTLAPDRPAGAAALAVIRAGGVPAGDLPVMLVPALGAAGSPRLVDSLLMALGSALQETTACEEATKWYQVALRRGRDPRVRREAGTGFVTCAVRLGHDALTTGHADEAEGWFLRAVRVDSVSAEGRLARVGLGDARVRQGDIIGAALAYQRVLDLSPPGASADSVAREAQARLKALEAPGGLP